jgi:hypothetical protein
MDSTTDNAKPESPDKPLQAPPLAAEATGGTPLAEALEPSAAAQTPAASLSLPSLLDELVALLEREPVLLVSLVYALVSIMGMWSEYWFYRRLDVPILDYLQASDLFLIGIRKPAYFLVVLASLAYVWGNTSALAKKQQLADSSPEARVGHRRRWLLEAPGWLDGLVQKANGLLRGTGKHRGKLLLSVGLMSLSWLFAWSQFEARRVLTTPGGGHQVRVTLAGASQPLPGTGRLLGTTSAYVMLWWPDAYRVDALPIANVARIQSARSPARPGGVADTRSKATAAPAAPTPAAGDASPPVVPAAPTSAPSASTPAATVEEPAPAP